MEPGNQTIQLEIQQSTLKGFNLNWNLLLVDKIYGKEMRHGASIQDKKSLRV